MDMGFLKRIDSIVNDPHTLIEFWNAAISGLVFVWVPILLRYLGIRFQRTLEKRGFKERIQEAVKRNLRLIEEIRANYLKAEFRNVDLALLESEVQNCRRILKSKETILFHRALHSVERVHSMILKSYDFLSQDITRILPGEASYEILENTLSSALDDATRNLTWLEEVLVRGRIVKKRDGSFMEYTGPIKG